MAKIIDTTHRILTGFRVKILYHGTAHCRVQFSDGSIRYIETKKLISETAIQQDQEPITTIPEFLRSIPNRVNVYLRASSGDKTNVG